MFFFSCMQLFFSGWVGLVVSLDLLQFWCCSQIPASIMTNVATPNPRSQNIRLVTNQSLSWQLSFFGASAISRAYADDEGMTEEVRCIKAHV